MSFNQDANMKLVTFEKRRQFIGFPQMGGNGGWVGVGTRLGEMRQQVVVK